MSCKSCFYTAGDTLNNGISLSLKIGLNELVGGIDEHVWGISYALSMLKCRPPLYYIGDQSKTRPFNFRVGDRGLIRSYITRKILPKIDFVCMEKPEFFVNDKPMSIDEMCNITCYIDEIYPLFKTNVSVSDLVKIPNVAIHVRPK